jgi:membrane protein YqaA with SNARE-associated domain
MIAAASVAAAFVVATRGMDEETGEAAMAFARVVVPIGMLVGGIVGYWLGSCAKRKRNQAEQAAAPDRPRE